MYLSLYNYPVSFATMKPFVTSLTLATTAFAASVARSTTCENNEVVVCNGNGYGGLISLGNIASGLLGDSCSGGDVYCCSEEDVQQVRCYCPR